MNFFKNFFNNNRSNNFKININEKCVAKQLEINEN